MENFLYGVLVVLVFYILYMIFFTCIKPRFALNDIFGLEFNVCDMKDLSSKNWKQLKEWISIIVYIGVFYIACTTFLIEGYQIPSQSMYPTFNGDKNPLIGDRIFALKGIHWIKPFKRGDIVIFISMEDYKTFIVKRLIGLPGDTIELKNNRVYVNGKPFSHRRYSKDYIKQIKTPYALNGVINDPSDLTEELRKDLRKRFLREEKNVLDLINMWFLKITILLWEIIQIRVMIVDIGDLLPNEISLEEQVSFGGLLKEEKF